MTNRDIVSPPLVLASFTSEVWLPPIQSISQDLALFMAAAGSVLVVLQIAYYWKQLRKK